MMRIWDQVRMLIIDEIWFSTKDQMEKMNACLNLVQRKRSNGNEVLSPNIIFDGYSIIFCGDVCQLPPVKVKENPFLYAGSGLWENSINVTIVSNYSHRLNDIQSLVKYWSKCGMEALQEKIELKSIKVYMDQKFSCQKLM